MRGGCLQLGGGVGVSRINYIPEQAQDIDVADGGLTVKYYKLSTKRIGENYQSK